MMTAHPRSLAHEFYISDVLEINIDSRGIFHWVHHSAVRQLLKPGGAPVAVDGERSGVVPNTRDDDWSLHGEVVVGGDGELLR